MMPVALIAFLGKPLGKFAFWAVLALLLAGAAGGTWIAIVKHYEAKGAAAVVAKEQAATAAEHERRVKSEEETQAWAKRAIELADQSEKHNADQQNDIAQKSAANDRVRCLDNAASQRLRPVGQARQPAGGGVAGRAR